MPLIGVRIRLPALAAVVAALALAVPALAGAAGPSGKVLVRFAPGTAAAKQASVLAAAGLTRVAAIPRIGVVVARPRAGATAAGAENRLDAQPQVLYAEREGGARAAATPTDPSYAAVPWTYTVPNVPGALDLGLGSATVYVLDSGVDFDQPDLAGATGDGYNTFSPGSDPTDDNGHGTRVAGTIAARANNGIGGAGVCPGCTVVPVKVLDSTGYGPWSNVAAGLVWAADQGARIVNLSLSSASSSQTLEDAVAYAVSKGAVVVAAGGNDSGSAATYPASLPGVIGVAGSDWNDRVYNGSNYGSWLKLAASGCYETTQSGGGYTNACGTSIASPIVAGVVGLMLSHNGSLTAAQVEDALEQTAVPVAERTDGSTNFACPAGGCVDYGRVDAAAAVASVGALPSAAAAPVLDGSAKVGQTLSVSNGTWDNAPTGYSYDFRRCDADGTSNCTSVQSGTQSTYALVAADYGKTIVVRVTATNAAGSGSATSAARTVGADAPTLAAVDLAGSTLVNQPLSTTTVAASVGGTAPIAVAYSWLRCDGAGASCAAISGQTGTSYTLALGDLGKTIRVRATATNLAGSVAFESAASDPITAVPIAPSFGALAPAVSGTATEGQTLSASQPHATGTAPVVYSGAWTRCDSAGSSCAATGVTASTYLLASVDVGKTLRYTLTATNGGGSATASGLSAVVAAAAATESGTGSGSGSGSTTGGGGSTASVAPSFGALAPVVTGTATVGQALAASQPAATGTAPISYTGAWTRCDATGASCAATGVTAATYTLTTADAGKTLRYTLTATNGTGSASATVLSAVVAAAAAAPTAGTTPAETSTKPDLSVLIEGPATATVGTAVHFRFTVRGRKGTGRATAAKLTVALPAEVALDKAQTADGAACTATGQSVVCRFDEVVPGVDAVAELWAKATSSGSGASTLKATVDSAGTDLNLTDNTAEAALRVSAATPPTAPPTTTGTTPPAETGGGTTGKKTPTPAPPPAPSGPQPKVAAVPAKTAARGAWVQLPISAKLQRTGLPSAAKVRYQWQVLMPPGNVWVAIAGATRARYTPDPSYAGLRLRVVATGGGKTAKSIPTPPLKPALEIAAPRATQVGSTLRAKLAPAVRGKRARVRYQWQLLDHGRWLPVFRATKPTFRPNRGSRGMNVRVVATVGGRSFASKPTTPVAAARKR